MLRRDRDQWQHHRCISPEASYWLPTPLIRGAGEVDVTDIEQAAPGWRIDGVNPPTSSNTLPSIRRAEIQPHHHGRGVEHPTTPNEIFNSIVNLAYAYRVAQSQRWA